MFLGYLNIADWNKNIYLVSISVPAFDPCVVPFWLYYFNKGMLDLFSYPQYSVAGGLNILVNKHDKQIQKQKLFTMFNQEYIYDKQLHKLKLFIMYWGLENRSNNPIYIPL